MKPQKQLFLHRPADGVWGDCHRTAIAIILGMDAKDVPHFAHDGAEADEFNRRVDEWLASRNLAQVQFCYGETSPEAMLAWMGRINPNAVWILSGESKNRVDHSVVCHGGKIICDPSLDDAGITGVCSDGYAWATVITHGTVTEPQSVG